jgi:hypothetical protein
MQLCRGQSGSSSCSRLRACWSHRLGRSVGAALHCTEPERGRRAARRPVRSLRDVTVRDDVLRGVDGDPRRSSQSQVSHARLLLQGCEPVSDREPRSQDSLPRRRSTAQGAAECSNGTGRRDCYALGATAGMSGACMNMITNTPISVTSSSASLAGTGTIDTWRAERLGRTTA